MLMIKFVMCAVLKTVSREDIQELNKMVMNYLEDYLQQMNFKVYQSNVFIVYNKQMLKFQVQVQNIHK